MPALPPEFPPVVLCLAASDATGGGGLQSDVLTLSSMGCHPLGVVTAVSVRDTRGVDDLLSIEPDVFALQARVVLEDIEVQAFKLGMCGGVENVAAVAEILSDYPDVPLVLEPALAYGPADEAEAEDMVAALTELILPQVTLLVASRDEVLRLAGPDWEADAPEDDLDDEEGGVPLAPEEAVARLLALGVEYVLLTGAGQHGPQVVNRLFGAEGLVRTDAWERLPGPFLGAGATLSAAAAAALAHGMDVPEAVREAQEFTQAALAAAFRPGMGPAIPDRFFWARPRNDEAY
ncbi:bifunctional hydroxymethylpyrimidine kinase/phosphomethylpyrimidine kinase [Pseudothauera rhizosphaerae]|uniref:Hydroxymethylpyrimidine/phosphomethylpyrimidine kinase n=1 Tax=Pseudothauera rhizosphaerae TaxID=2565932 RepID=A0A4S4AQ32_9RHOO|nr:bifunctional hydroxymethylpyrimidine kinase/phosphomethylpyrimidine kinase [Pseudothauera rhizosphaerae]THF61273.1 hydroxymethylpyrimidine/phosphomethylpyrimidine kinase [Pseudothauera rhizosphaerae]